MSRIVDNISDFFFPNRCALCDCFIPWNALICEKCRGKITETQFCPKCGKSPCTCHDGHSYDGCAVFWPYEGEIRNGILLFKYHRGFNIAKLAAPKLSEMLSKAGALENAIITAVPMSRRRRLETGYNQAEYIARLISRITGAKRDFNLLERIPGGSLQHDLSAQERRKNAEEVYTAKKRRRDIAGNNIVLCDDIITTGSTLDVCASLLKNMGAAKVYCAVLASTPLNSVSGSETNVGT